VLNSLYRTSCASRYDREILPLSPQSLNRALLLCRASSNLTSDGIAEKAQHTPTLSVPTHRKPSWLQMPLGRWRAIFGAIGLKTASTVLEDLDTENLILIEASRSREILWASLWIVLPMLSSCGQTCRLVAGVVQWPPPELARYCSIDLSWEAQFAALPIWKTHYSSMSLFLFLGGRGLHPKGELRQP